MAESDCPERYQIAGAFALIIVNNHYTCRGYPDRPGSGIDKNRVVEFCRNAGCTRDVRDDLTADEMKNLFTTISQRDFSANDAFVCFISSHGNPEGVQGVDGNIVTINEILSPFKRCNTLVGKPKLFFIQIDQGNQVEVGEIRYGGAPNPSIPRLPIEADFLVAYSSVDGYESYRNLDEGSWFIIMLTQVLEEYPRNKSLTDILTIVNKRVADKQTVHGRKQMPCFTSTLRMCVHFTSVVQQLSL